MTTTAHLLLLRIATIGISLFVAQEFSAAQDAEKTFQTKLADPVFRFQASQPEGVRRFAVEALALKAEEKLPAYEWLRANVKADKEHALECTLLSWLARDLKRPAEEIMKADDLVLQAAPDEVEAWLNRAEFYAEDKDAEKSKWALDMYAQALKRVNFSTTDWRVVLRDGEAAWRGRMVQAGKIGALADALADALRNTPRGEARTGAADLLQNFLRDKAVRDAPPVALSVLDAVASHQPQIALGSVSAFMELARAFATAGQHDVARRISRMIILAPVPEETARFDENGGGSFSARWRETHPQKDAPPPTDDALATAKYEKSHALYEARVEQAARVRAGYQTLRYLWEDTMPRYQPDTQARKLLAMALGENDPLFVEQCQAEAKAQPWNESLLSHTLLAAALTDGLAEEALSIAAGLAVADRARTAQRLCAFAPVERLPLVALSAWLEEGALALIAQSQEKQRERSVFESLIFTLDWLERAGQGEQLRHVLSASLKSPPRALDTAHWARLSLLVMRHGTETEAGEFTKTWLAALDRLPVEKEHLPAMAAAAVRGGKVRGAELAQEALEIWKRRYAEEERTSMPDAAATSQVAEALLACGKLSAFNEVLERLQKQDLPGRSTASSRLTLELTALRDLLEGTNDRFPAVEAWIQAPEAADKAARLVWRFVLPELDGSAGRLPPISISIVNSNGSVIDSNTPAAPVDGRWWAAGTTHPLLEQLAGRYDLDVLAGKIPEKLRVIGSISEAGASGSVEVTNPPESGALRVNLRSRSTGALSQGEFRLFSVMPPVYATGREPATYEETAPLGEKFVPRDPPPSWKLEDVERWGRLASAPIVIEEGTEYLLTDWPQMARRAGLAGQDTAAKEERPLPVSLILLDEKQRPLGPVPMASTGFHRGTNLSSVFTPHRNHTQRFRPADWVGEDDLVRLRSLKGLPGFTPDVPRYMVFVTRAPGEGALPLLQLRPYHEHGTGAPPSTTVGESELSQLPELNGEFVAHIGFRVRAWHVTMGAERGIFSAKGALAGFDVAHIPWKPLVRTESELLDGTEWPLVFAAERALVIEPSWGGNRSLGVRLVPFNDKGKDYAACERKELPIPTFNRAELPPSGDGALLMVSSTDTENPQPVAAWLEPDGKCHVCPLPQRPLKGNPGLEVAWWGPQASRMTLHEDGMLFHLEHIDGLRVISAEPGTPDDMPEGGKKPRSKKRPKWTLERPDILAEHDVETGITVRRFHLPMPCEGKPMNFEKTNPVFIFTKEHDILRVNPPPRK